jgi:alpha/beta superfamily hydrolase
MQPVKEETLRFAGGGLSLEGRIALPPGTSRGAVVCHPHPQYGGDMDNPVVFATTHALQDLGIATLRFNFRGVGASEGRYSGGFAEADDARAAVTCLREKLSGAVISLGGYSFGAMVALLAGPDHPDVERLFAIALPATMFDATPIEQSNKPKLFLLGDRDQYCAYPAMEALVARLAGENSLVRIAGADHFFLGLEERVGSEVARFVNS